MSLEHRALSDPKSSVLTAIAHSKKIKHYEKIIFNILSPSPLRNNGFRSGQ